MLFLNDSDMRSSISYDEMMNAVEHAFILLAKNECNMIERLVAGFGVDSMLYMPCMADGMIGTKILAEFPGNPARGFPYLNGIMLLNDADNGSVKAIMNGQTLTALRTGAVGGLALKYFSGSDIKTLGIVGCGVQGLHQAVYALAVRDIETIYVYNRGDKDLSSFFEKIRCLSGKDNVSFSVCKSADELLGKSEAVITATQAKEPLFEDNPDAFRGKCMIGIGSWQPVMREYPDAIFYAADNIITDLPYALKESGDFTQPLDAGVLHESRVEFMGNWLLKHGQGNNMPVGRTCFYKSVGMGILDVVAANCIYRNALEIGIGQQVDW